MKKLLQITLSAILIIGVILAVCENPAPAATPSPSPDQPKSGGVLRIGKLTTQIIAPGYPPTMLTGTDITMSGSCLETLIRWTKNYNLVGQLATDWKVSDDAKSIILTLRKGVKFHDGSDFNAEVAKWNLENFRLSEKMDLKNISSIDIVDDYTIRLNLSAYNSLIVSSLTAEAGIMISKKAFESQGKEWCESHPVGTGPFKFVNWTKDVSLKYERFDGYWGGKPYLDGVEILLFANDTTAVMAFRKGELDILHVRLDKDANTMEAEGYKITRDPFGPLTWLAGDSIHPDSPFADIRVRQAMSYALDLKTISQTLSGGVWQPLNQWGVSGFPVYNRDVVGYPYNPDKARQLLAEAGYPNGFDTILNYCTIPLFDTMIAAIQGYLKEVGIRAKLAPLQLAAYFKMVGPDGPGWDNGICHCLTQSKPDMVQSWVSYGDRYKTMAHPPGYDGLFAKVLQATEENTKNSLAQKLNKLMTDEFCMASWLWQQQMLHSKQPYVHDDMWGVVPGGYLNPKAWLSEK